jgi:hypothetical protein
MFRDERGHGRASALVDPTPQCLGIDGGGDAGQRGPAITGTVFDTHDHVTTVGVHQADHGVGQQRWHLLEVARPGLEVQSRTLQVVGRDTPTPTAARALSTSFVSID